MFQIIAIQIAFHVKKYLNALQLYFKNNTEPFGA